jgi:hypothetical protein
VLALLIHGQRFVDPGTQIHQFDSLRFGHVDAAN